MKHPHEMTDDELRCLRGGGPGGAGEGRIRMNHEQRRTQGCCFDCGRRYGDEYGFPDLVVPNHVWRQISPTGDEGGLLCPSCICRRLYLANVNTVGRFTSGPLCADDARNALFAAVPEK